MNGHELKMQIYIQMWLDLVMNNRKEKKSCLPHIFGRCFYLNE